LKFYRRQTVKNSLYFYGDSQKQNPATFFYEIKRHYIKLASRLIKNLLVPLGTLVRKRVRLKQYSYIICF
jgi:hypothetical protein